MIRSMTAFARRESTDTWGTAYWELRSVNNRYLDIVPRLPEDVRALETAVRERIRARIKRGKVDCTLRLTLGSQGGSLFALNLDLAARLAEAAHEIEALLHDPARVNAMDVMRWPGVVQTEAPDLDALGRAVLELLDAALDELVASREREGQAIDALIAGRCREMSAIVAAVRKRLPEALAEYRQRLAERLAEVREQLDAERLEQEMVLMAHKTDVAEELDRLEAHIAEVSRVLAEEDPAGRRLDFLMQELNREANTLAAKSMDADTTRASVDLKVLIEQVREQVQNVE
ncbi:MAG: YicC/YloC family endoribonuclease [Gammaproteobacteria bacterium]|nr:YicC/YloC family endoribonuclease [Gammaproteobacteria bacterium]